MRDVLRSGSQAGHKPGSSSCVAAAYGLPHSVQYRLHKQCMQSRPGLAAGVSHSMHALRPIPGTNLFPPLMTSESPFFHASIVQSTRTGHSRVQMFLARSSLLADSADGSLAIVNSSATLAPMQAARLYQRGSFTFHDRFGFSFGAFTNGGFACCFRPIYIVTVPDALQTEKVCRPSYTSVCQVPRTDDSFDATANTPPREFRVRRGPLAQHGCPVGHVPSPVLLRHLRRYWDPWHPAPLFAV